MTWTELKEKHAAKAGLSVVIDSRADRRARRQYSRTTAGTVVGRCVMFIRVSRAGKNLYTGTIRGDVDAFLNTQVPGSVSRLV